MSNPDIPVWRPATLTIDDEHGWPGFTNQFMWNGWNLVAFERTTVEEILRSGQITDSEGKHSAWSYDEEHDQFIVYDYAIPLVVKGRDLIVAGVPHHVYPLGSGEWIWDELEQKP